MSLPLPSEYVVNEERLGLGLELVDAPRRGRIASALAVTLDTPFAPGVAARLEAIPRHESCVHVLLDRPGLKNPLPVRIWDSTRRFCPRRLRIPFPAAPVALSPRLFPGAAYDVTTSATGVRGRLLRGSINGPVVRWARAEARLTANTPGTGTLIGRAHGDDRGEFLLLIGNAAATIGDIVDPLQVEVTVFGPAAAPTPAFPDLPDLDPYWDVPQEDTSLSGVVEGERLPTGYVFTSTSRITVPLELGRITSVFDLVL